MIKFKITCLLLILLFPATVSSECTCNILEESHQGNREALNYKLASIASVLVCGAIGVSLPLLGRSKIPTLRPENDIFFMIKAFAAGVILSTAFIHILPQAFDALTSPCLEQNPWRNFPFTGLFAMVSAIGTLMLDSFATGFYKRLHSKNNKHVNVDEEKSGEDELSGEDDHSGHIHATHGHAHGFASPTQDPGLPDLIRRRIISQVLELGILVHSVIIGISLGASQSSETIKPLLVALSFHQFFEGMGLGGSISEAKFKFKSTVIMATFFYLTTPTGIGIGIGISSVYKENIPTALIVEGILNSASAGILIYMALVDILAVDFMNPRVLTNFRIQFGADVSLLLGAGCMSLLAIWA